MNIEYIPAKNKTLSYLFGPGRPWPMRRLHLLAVIHWLAGTFASGIRWAQAPSNNKSSWHYQISVDGRIVQLVDAKEVAWHAGESHWKDYPTYPANYDVTANPIANSETGDRTYKAWNSLNPCSIGIELEGPPSSIGTKSWPKIQIEKCAELLRMISDRYPGIKLIDHSRICSAKIDVIKGTGYPEDVFPWAELVELSGLEEA